MVPRYLINKPLRWTKYREGIFTFFEFSYLGRKIVGGQLLLSTQKHNIYRIYQHKYSIHNGRLYLLAIFTFCTKNFQSANKTDTLPYNFNKAIRVIIVRISHQYLAALEENLLSVWSAAYSMENFLNSSLIKRL